MLTLAAEKREKSGARAPALRRAGKLPAVVYGPKQKATSVTLARKEFERVFKDAGESSVIELSGLGEPLQVLVHEVDHDPIKSTPRHVDFYAIEKGAKVEVAVPIVFTGESPAVRAGANLVKVLHELTIEAEVANLPHDVTVDISVLAAVGDRIHVKDIVIPPGVTLVTEPEEVIALAQEVVEEVEEAPTAIDMDAIEVEKKGKEETEEQGAEAGNREQEQGAGSRSKKQEA